MCTFDRARPVGAASGLKPEGLESCTMPELLLKNEGAMNIRRVRTVLLVGVLLGAAAFSTLQARQAADRAAFQSLQIALPVTDINRSVEFYRTVLEFESVDLLPFVRGPLTLSPNAPPTRPSRATFSVGGQYVTLQQGLKEGLRANGIRLMVRVANPAEYAARLQARGAAVSVAPFGLNGQPADFTVTDPDGYHIHFCRTCGGFEVR